jgi:inhibitor of cysteine peptidase
LPLDIFTANDNGAAITLTVGASFTVRLPENPTTGYRWRIDAWDQTLLERARDEFISPATVVPGAGGEHIWEFGARAPGETTLTLMYERIWENNPPASVFSLAVSVA